MKISGHGIEIDLPAGWEGRIYRRPQARPILHCGSLPLPQADGDFGTAAVSALGPGDVFVALLEYDAALAGSGLFSAPGMPLPFHRSQVSSKVLQRRLPGRAGIQRFFTQSGRPFCLYLAVGTGLGVQGPIDRANRVLSTVSISPPGGDGA